VERPGGELGPLDGVRGDPGDGLERAEEAADAGRGLDGVNGRPVVREARHERRDDARDFPRDPARRVELLGEFGFA
jgi:hypothetical protein